ncbi:hypothetical protein LTR78_003232 [Recurvomyces mirabilis]|uniref:Uncharacterized protein n=1 Tax=Recurvomyces mirabilis TaxID=574656 RepID=A0AAE1C3Q8_9PEZI|nr:hypothetical protein LTR78_003232 [Recurvomyces mirabilis]KAK5156951.1 hypothetical protein LTS14_004468 [Recurvomyces mirabilis]
MSQSAPIKTEGDNEDEVNYNTGTVGYHMPASNSYHHETSHNGFDEHGNAREDNADEQYDDAAYHQQGLYSAHQTGAYGHSGGADPEGDADGGQGYGGDSQQGQGYGAEGHGGEGSGGAEYEGGNYGGEGHGVEGYGGEENEDQVAVGQGDGDHGDESHRHGAQAYEHHRYEETGRVEDQDLGTEQYGDFSYNGELDVRGMEVEAGDPGEGNSLEGAPYPAEAQDDETAQTDYGGIASMYGDDAVDDEMGGDEMGDDEMGDDEMGGDEMGDDEMGDDEMGGDEMDEDDEPVDQRVSDKLAKETSEALGCINAVATTFPEVIPLVQDSCREYDEFLTAVCSYVQHILEPGHHILSMEEADIIVGQWRPVIHELVPGLSKARIKHNIKQMVVRALIDTAKPVVAPRLKLVSTLRTARLAHAELVEIPILGDEAVQQLFRTQRPAVCQSTCEDHKTKVGKLEVTLNQIIANLRTLGLEMAKQKLEQLSKINIAGANVPGFTTLSDTDRAQDLKRLWETIHDKSRLEMLSSSRYNIDMEQLQYKMTYDIRTLITRLADHTISNCDAALNILAYGEDAGLNLPADLEEAIRVQSGCRGGMREHEV